MLIYVHIWMNKSIPTKPHSIFSISACGVHLFSGGNPPMSRRVYALNSFVLPAQRWMSILLLYRVIALMEFIQFD